MASSPPAPTSYPIAVTFGVQVPGLAAISDPQTTTVDALAQAQVIVPKSSCATLDLLPSGINPPTLIIIRPVKAGVSPVQADTLSAADEISFSVNSPNSPWIKLLGTQVYANGMALLIQSATYSAGSSSASSPSPPSPSVTYSSPQSIKFKNGGTRDVTVLVIVGFSPLPITTDS